jgi:6-phosphogluconolactonase (cycloisomerase 2 family)
VTTLFWGTYPPAGLGTPVGQGEGIYIQRGPDADLALVLDAPSFVVAHPSLPLIFAVSESGESQFHVIRVDEGDLSLIASVPTGGVEACHILLSPDATVAYVSHYGSGDIAVLRLGDDGLPVSERPQQLHGHEGSGPREDRQESPHAHFAGYAPGGRHLLVADLGTDELRRYRVVEDGLLEPDGIAATLPPGSGPRHFVVRGENIYLVCELDHQLRTLRWAPADAEADVIAEVPTTRAPQRTGNDVYDAHIALVGEDVLLVSVRGVDVIAVFDLSPEGEARYRTSLDAGEWPRYFAVIGDRVHVGAERGHEVRSYELARVLALPPENSVGGMAALPYESAKVVSPACVTA